MGPQLPQSMLTDSQVKRDARTALQVYKRMQMSDDSSNLMIPRNESSELRHQLEADLQRFIETSDKTKQDASLQNDRWLPKRELKRRAKEAEVSKKESALQKKARRLKEVSKLTSSAISHRLRKSKYWVTNALKNGGPHLKEGKNI